MSEPGNLFETSVEILKKLISIQSFSGEETSTADLLQEFFQQSGMNPKRKANNIWCVSNNCDSNAPILLLNSHHDTVKPGNGWQGNPFEPVLKDDKLYGLGSNDAGASVVSLVATFRHFASQPKIPYRIIIAITAEEEISGANGISSILDDLGSIDLAIVGEPTEMQMAVAEKGLVVLDCTSEGKSGHAARDEGVNAIYCALEDIEFLRKHKFEKSSDLLGSVKMTVTQIKAGQQHNVVPANCQFVVDVRTNEHYSNQQVVAFLQEHLKATVIPRSLRLNSSGISLDHPIVVKGLSMGIKYFGSPTLSDQALMDFPSIKIGPGKSSRSHTADEFVLLSEIREGIDTYINLLTDLNI
ncbi:MAG: acetylornithine deacetylase [Cyclobacteriaceae bacterium]|nr:MAG: acetylornithine deacetylase [Cyclobacteriaceae bacterium]